MRASARTPAEREEHYRDWRERHDAYLSAVADNGGVPWTHDEDERRDLFFRRYQRPAPPQGLSNNLTEIRREPVTTRPPAAPGADEIRGTAYAVDYEEIPAA